MRRNGPLTLLVIVLWALTAWNRSLWGDEFHALHHARIEGLSAFFETVRSDNHPPLAFLFLRWSMALFGEGHLALRLPGLIAALLFTRLAIRFAQRLPDPAARAWGPWLVALSSYRLVVFTEARMYGWLALCVLGLLEALAAALEDERSPWWAAPWVAIGLHTHYYFFNYLFVLGACVLAVAWAVPEKRAQAGRLIAAGALGATLFLPWLALGFLHQLGHGLPAGSNYHTPLMWLQSIAHLLYMNASLGGEWVSLYVALPGAIAAAILGLCGLGRFRSAGSKRVLIGLLAAGIGAPLWAFLLAGVIPRHSYNWPYIAGSCAPVLFLVAAGLGSPPRWLRNALLAVLVATLSLVTLINATSRGQEDFRGCVEFILANARAGDAVVTRAVWDQDPAGSPTGWRYYLDRIDPPPGAVVPDEYRLPDFEGALQHDRVWVFIRRRWNRAALERLQAAYPNQALYPIGAVMSVRSFWR
jgi:uncharacterized membrane protein